MFDDGSTLSVPRMGLNPSGWVYNLPYSTPTLTDFSRSPHQLTNKANKERPHIYLLTRTADVCRPDVVRYGSQVLPRYSFVTAVEFRRGGFTFRSHELSWTRRISSTLFPITLLVKIRLYLLALFFRDGLLPEKNISTCHSCVTCTWRAWERAPGFRRGEDWNEWVLRVWEVIEVEETSEKALQQEW
jgi:hypothetical protein